MLVRKTKQGGGLGNFIVGGRGCNFGQVGQRSTHRERGHLKVDQKEELG